MLLISFNLNKEWGSVTPVRMFTSFFFNMESNF